MGRIGTAMLLLAMVGCGSNGQSRPEAVTPADGSPDDSATAQDGAGPRDAGASDSDGAVPECPVSDGSTGYPILPSPPEFDASGAQCNPTGTVIEQYTYEPGPGGAPQGIGGPLCDCPAGSSCFQGLQGTGPLVYCRVQ